MKMANHPRPGDIIQESLDELNVSLREFARAMEIAPSTGKPIADRKSSFDARNGNKTFRGDRQFAANVAESAKCLESGRGGKNGGCVATAPSGYAIKKWHLIKRHLKLMTNATLPDALRLSGLHVHCNLLDLNGL
ncbi:putative plasmid maintenance protein [Escherichia coli]|nr:putative plasmid maintenance protein [Escherichia coli]